MEHPSARFRGKSWDQDGKPIDRDQSPGDVRLLPLLGLTPKEALPAGVSAHLLGGNWYGDGPEIVLWDGLSEMQFSFPLWDRKHLPHWLRRLAKAGQIKKKNPAKVIRDGGVWVNGA